jgi:hypothetical protein
LEEWLTVRRRVAIAGIVVDDISGKPVAGAYLEITAKPEAYATRVATLGSRRGMRAEPPQRPDTARTRTNGLFFFLDLPEGDYGLVGFLPRQGVPLRNSAPADGDARDLFERIGDKRYGKGEFKASVSYEPDVPVEPDERERPKKLAVFRLPPTGIRGRVVSSVDQSAVVMAQVRVKGSGESAFTDERGQYAILRMWPDHKNRDLQVRARGYRDNSIPALINQPGTCNTLPDITLVPERG